MMMMTVAILGRSVGGSGQVRRRQWRRRGGDEGGGLRREQARMEEVSEGGGFGGCRRACSSVGESSVVLEGWGGRW